MEEKKKTKIGLGTIISIIVIFILILVIGGLCVYINNIKKDKLAQNESNKMAQNANNTNLKDTEIEDNSTDEEKFMGTLKQTGSYEYGVRGEHTRGSIILRDNYRIESLAVEGQAFLGRGIYEIKDNKLIVTLNEFWTPYHGYHGPEEGEEYMMALEYSNNPRWEKFETPSTYTYTIIDENTLHFQWDPNSSILVLRHTEYIDDLFNID